MRIIFFSQKHHSVSKVYFSAGSDSDSTGAGGCQIEKPRSLGARLAIVAACAVQENLNARTEDGLVSGARAQAQFPAESVQRH